MGEQQREKRTLFFGGCSKGACKGRVCKGVDIEFGVMGCRLGVQVGHKPVFIVSKRDVDVEE